MTNCTGAPDLQSALAKATEVDSIMPLFESRLSEAVGFSVRLKGLAIPRVFVRKDKTILIQYVFEPQTSASEYSGSVILCGELGAPTESEAESASGDRKSIYISELQLTLHLFPFDRRLKQLSDCFTSDNQALWYRPTELRVADSGLTFTPQETLAYRLGKRCVMRGNLKYPKSDGKPSELAILKIARPRQVAKSLAAYDILESAMTVVGDPHFALATNLFTDIGRGLILTESVSAPTLYSMTLHSKTSHPTTLHTSYQRIGRCLRKMQSYAVPDGVHLQTYTAREERVKLELNLSLISNVLSCCNEQPQSALLSKFQSALKELGDCPSQNENVATTLSHRDFYDKQLFVANDKVTLIDFDTLASSDSMLDVANFLAHISLRMRQGLIDESFSQDAQKRFMEGYTDDNDALETEAMDRLGWWYKATMLRLAALYFLRPKWRRLADVLIADSLAGYSGVFGARAR
jgi:Phosphotransferase enzyme family